jgi:ABC-2 type transport system permease protein
LDCETERKFTVGELAEMVGVSVRTLQYYDGAGLLKATFSEGGRRMYGQKDLLKLQQILFLKSLGFPLQKIKDNILQNDDPGTLIKLFSQQRDIMGTPEAIVKMQESGTLRAFRVNGIPSSAVLTVQALGAFLHLLIVTVIIYLAAPAAFHSEFPKNPPLYFGVLAVFLAASIGIGMLIGVFSKNQSVATMLSMAVFLPTMMLSGIMFPASMLPEALLWVGRIFPATHALQALLGLAYQTKTDWNAYLSFGIVAGIGILAYGIAALRFNRTRKSEQA